MVISVQGLSARFTLCGIVQEPDLSTEKASGIAAGLISPA
jgi:hypothetical protein